MCNKNILYEMEFLWNIYLKQVDKWVSLWSTVGYKWVTEIDSIQFEFNSMILFYERNDFEWRSMILLSILDDIIVNKIIYI